MRAMRILMALGVVLIVASCVTVRDRLSARPGAPAEPVEDVAAEPAPLAAGAVRITVVADTGIPSFRLQDDGEEVGVIEGGGTLQWDRPAGVVELVAKPLSDKHDMVRFYGLLSPGERELPLVANADGSLVFSGDKLARLSEAHRISRLRRRAQRLTLDMAVAYLEEHLFAAPAPGRLRSAYADADQKIVADGSGPVLTWTRYDSSGGRISKLTGGRGGTQRRNMKHAFADFVDADMRLGVTVRVAFRRNPRDIEPARLFFRLTGDGSVGSRLESLLVALMVCCPSH